MELSLNYSLLLQTIINFEYTCYSKKKLVKIKVHINNNTQFINIKARLFEALSCKNKINTKIRLHHYFCDIISWTTVIIIIFLCHKVFGLFLLESNINVTLNIFVITLKHNIVRVFIISISK